MAGTEGSETARRSESQKTGPSSDCGLQPAHMKSELLVIANQHVAVNAFPGLVHTARHTTEVGSARSQWANPAHNFFGNMKEDCQMRRKLCAGRQLSKARSMTGVKS